MKILNLEKFLNNIFEIRYLKKFENNNYLFILISLLSFILTSLFSNGLNNNQALGMHTLSIFIPYFLYSIFLTFENKFNYFKFFIFLFISILPLYDYLFNEIFHLEGDDSTFYTLSAQYMIDNQTLRSTYSDEVLIDLQPGISYLLALEMLIFGNQNRFMQIFNVSVFFFIIYFYAYQIKKKHEFNRLIFVVLIFIIPYSVKNILYTYSEWFVVWLFALSLIAINKKNLYLAVIFLSLVPFVRQNLIIACFIILLTYLIIEKDNMNPVKFLISLILFFGILLLPLYHNMYYANEIVFLAKQKPYNISAAKSLFDLINPIFILENFNDYLRLLISQFERIFLLDGRKITNIIISFFVPILFIISFLNFFSITNKFFKFLYFFIVVSTFAPTILLGGLAAPRFEYVNLSFIYLFFTLLNVKRNEINK